MAQLSTAELAILNTEITTDPVGMGYSLTDNSLTAELLNTPRAAYQVPNEEVSVQEILDATDFTELSQASQQRGYMILTAREDIQVTPAIVVLVQEIFGPGTNSRAQLSLLQTRDGSRAEEVLGRQGVKISSSNVNEALNP